MRVSTNGGGHGGAVASLLLTHNAALDEHHDQPAFLFAVAQAISSGSRKGLFITSRTLRCCWARAVLPIPTLTRTAIRRACMPPFAVGFRFTTWSSSRNS